MTVAPFHAAAAPAAPLARRLLLVSHPFPPGTEPGALRWEKMSHVAVERGWQVDVVTQDPAALARRDDTRLAGLPAGTRVFGVAAPAGLPARAARARGRARGAHGAARPRRAAGARRRRGPHRIGRCRRRPPSGWATTRHRPPAGHPHASSTTCA
jgi:hypothetical protein